MIFRIFAEKLKLAFNKKEEIEQYKQDLNLEAYKTKQSLKETKKAFKDFDNLMKKCRAHLIALAVGIKINEH